MTEPYYADDAVTLLHGDALALLADIEDGSIDAVVTDPPYGLGFMGREWDQPDQYGSTRRGGSDRPFTAGTVGQDHRTTTERSASMHAGRYDLSPTAMQSFGAWCEAWAIECLRVLKPGGHLLAFGGSRTWHRLACAVEDAGFEVRDSIAWLYGQGFPKSLDVSKAIDKAAGATREASGERGNTECTYLDRGEACAGHDDAGQSMSGATVHRLPTAPATDAAARWQGWGTALKPAFEPIVVGRKPLVGTVAGNVLAHGTGALNIDACRTATVEALRGSTVRDDIRGGKYGGGHRAANDLPAYEQQESGRWPTNVVLDGHAADELDRQSGVLTSGANPTRRGSDKFRDAYGDFQGQEECVAHRGADSGGASRFFPTFRYEAKAPAAERPRDGDVAHPTVKPLDLMRWLVRLVTPPGGVVLDPFAGSGTTAEACVIEGFRCIAIEREAAYLPLITARLSKPIALDLFGGTA